MPLPEKVSDAVRRLNPALFGGTMLPIAPVAKPRLRQNRGPILNTLETAFLDWLQGRNPTVKFHAQSVTIKIANGCRYSPDFVAKMPDGEIHAWETKGPHAFDGALEKLKMAASVYPEIHFWLVSRDKATAAWRIERVLP